MTLLCLTLTATVIFSAMVVASFCPNKGRVYMVSSWFICYSVINRGSFEWGKQIESSSFLLLRGVSSATNKIQTISIGGFTFLVVFNTLTRLCSLPFQRITTVGSHILSELVRFLEICANIQNLTTLLLYAIMQSYRRHLCEQLFGM